jgi:rare lipoprotein A
MAVRRGALLALLVGTWSGAALAEGPDSPSAHQEAEHLATLPPVTPAGSHVDPSGRKQKGRASYYSTHFAHRKMADGQSMNPQSNVAASKNLPLGTTAKVTNLQNGKSANVKVEDRGPYAAGRVIDVSPTVADQLDLKKEGTAPVEVKPITVPQPNGAIKLGAGGAEATPKEVTEGAETTKQITGAPAASTTGR